MQSKVQVYTFKNSQFIPIDNLIVDFKIHI